MTLMRIRFDALSRRFSLPILNTMLQISLLLSLILILSSEYEEPDEALPYKHHQFADHRTQKNKEEAMKDYGRQSLSMPAILRYLESTRLHSNKYFKTKQGILEQHDMHNINGLKNHQTFQNESLIGDTRYKQHHKKKERHDTSLHSSRTTNTKLKKRLSTKSKSGRSSNHKQINYLDLINNIITKGIKKRKIQKLKRKENISSNEKTEGLHRRNNLDASLDGAIVARNATIAEDLTNESLESRHMLHDDDNLPENEEEHIRLESEEKKLKPLDERTFPIENTFKNPKSTKKSINTDQRKDVIPYPFFAMKRDHIPIKKDSLPLYNLPSNPLPQQLLSFPAQYPEMLNLQPMDKLYTSAQSLDLNEEDIVGQFLRKEKLEEESLKDTDPDHLIRTDERGNLYQDDTNNFVPNSGTVNSIAKSPALEALAQLETMPDAKEADELTNSIINSAKLHDQFKSPSQVALANRLEPLNFLSLHGLKPTNQWTSDFKSTHRFKGRNKRIKTIDGEPKSMDQLPTKIRTTVATKPTTLPTTILMTRTTTTTTKESTTTAMTTEKPITTLPSATISVQYDSTKAITTRPRTLAEKKETERQALHLLKNSAIRRKLERIKMLEEKLDTMQRLEQSRRKHLLMATPTVSGIKLSSLSKKFKSKYHQAEKSFEKQTSPILKTFFQNPQMTDEPLIAIHKNSNSSIFQDALYDRGKVLNQQNGRGKVLNQQNVHDVIASKKHILEHHDTFPLMSDKYLAELDEEEKIVSDHIDEVRSPRIENRTLPDVTSNKESSSEDEHTNKSPYLEKLTDNEEQHRSSDSKREENKQLDNENAVVRSMNEFTFNGRIKLDPSYQGNVKIVHGTPPPEFLQAFATQFPPTRVTTPFRAPFTLPPDHATSQPKLPTFSGGYPWIWYKNRKQPTTSRYRDAHAGLTTRQPLGGSKENMTDTMKTRLLPTNTQPPNIANSPTAASPLDEDYLIANNISSTGDSTKTANNGKISKEQKAELTDEGEIEAQKDLSVVTSKSSSTTPKPDSPQQIAVTNKPVVVSTVAIDSNYTSVSWSNISNPDNVSKTTDSFSSSNETVMKDQSEEIGSEHQQSDATTTPSTTTAATTTPTTKTTTETTTTSTASKTKTLSNVVGEKASEEEKFLQLNGKATKENAKSVPIAQITYEKNSRHHQEPNDIILDEAQDFETKQHIETKSVNTQKQNYSNGKNKKQRENLLGLNRLAENFDASNLDKIYLASKHTHEILELPVLHRPTSKYESVLQSGFKKPINSFYMEPTDELAEDIGDKRGIQQYSSYTLKELEDEKETENKEKFNRDEKQSAIGTLIKNNNQDASVRSNNPTKGEGTKHDLEGIETAKNNNEEESHRQEKANDTLGENNESEAPSLFSPTDHQSATSKLEDYENDEKIIDVKTMPTERKFITTSESGAESHITALVDQLNKEVSEDRNAFLTSDSNNMPERNTSSKPDIQTSSSEPTFSYSINGAVETHDTVHAAVNASNITANSLPNESPTVKQVVPALIGTQPVSTFYTARLAALPPVLQTEQTNFAQPTLTAPIYKTVEDTNAMKTINTNGGNTLLPTMNSNVIDASATNGGNIASIPTMNLASPVNMLQQPIIDSRAAAIHTGEGKLDKSHSITPVMYESTQNRFQPELASKPAEKIIQPNFVASLPQDIPSQPKLDVTEEKLKNNGPFAAPTQPTSHFGPVLDERKTTEEVTLKKLTQQTTKSMFDENLNMDDMYWTDSPDEIENTCRQQKGTNLVVNVLAFGDSLTRGYYNKGKNHHPYTMKLQYLLNKMDAKRCFIVENEGRDGDMVIGEMPKRIEDFYDHGKKQFEWVIILGGTNDIYNKKNVGHHTAAELTQNILSVHHIAHQHGAKTVAVTIPEVECQSSEICQDMKQTREAVNDNIRTFALGHKNSVMLCDLAGSLVRNKINHRLVGQFFEGGLHLKPRGYETMAKIIFESLRQALDK